MLIGYNSSQPDGTQVAAYVAAHTQRLGLLVAHRPGFMAPTLAARMFATIDQFAGGRIAVHVITGGSEYEDAIDYGRHLLPLVREEVARRERQPIAVKRQPS